MAKQCLSGMVPYELKYTHSLRILLNRIVDLCVLRPVLVDWKNEAISKSVSRFLPIVGVGFHIV